MNHEALQNIVQPKSGLSIGNQNQGPISVSEPKFFFPKPKLFFFQIFFIFSHFFGESKFL